MFRKQDKREQEDKQVRESSQDHRAVLGKDYYNNLQYYMDLEEEGHSQGCSEYSKFYILVVIRATHEIIITSAIIRNFKTKI